MTTSPKKRTAFEVYGDYVLLKNLASGGMAEVFLARPAKPGGNGRILVIKRILREIANDPIFIKMFRSEIQTILGFSHPHTIQLHDSGEVEGQPYIAMEYIEGKSLREITAKFAEKGEPIPVPTVLGLIAQAASGLSYAHHFENTATGEVVNAVHRDISPHNLIVSYRGNLKVIDFGIAKAKNGIAEKTRAGQIKGKCGYLSPEQLAEENLDGRSDIFSLGIVAWELLTSEKLFQKQGDTELQIIKRIENCEQYITPPSSRNPEISPEVDEVILKALEKNPNDRYPSAAAFQAALRTVLLKHYPHYAYGDTAFIMQALFESDLALERMELRELNDRAQEILVAQWEEKTKVVTKEKSGLMANLFRGFGRTRNELPDMVELRVSKLETLLRQKASSRHFALFAFYLLSIVAIKLDERYSLLDRFFLSAQAQAEVSADDTLSRPSFQPNTTPRPVVQVPARAPLTPKKDILKAAASKPIAKSVPPAPRRPTVRSMTKNYKIPIKKPAAVASMKRAFTSPSPKNPSRAISSQKPVLKKGLAQK